VTDPASDLVVHAAGLVRRVRRELGVPAAYRVLAVLDDIGPASISQLATADGTSQPTMSTQVATLVAEGYVAKTPDPHDARVQVLTITEAGHAHLMANRRRIADAIRGDLAGHSDEQLAVAVAVLKSLTEKGNA
jgi:DNA-binding MarR family transcriptional regulator